MEQFSYLIARGWSDTLSYMNALKYYAIIKNEKYEDSCQCGETSGIECGEEKAKHQ